MAVKPVKPYVPRNLTQPEIEKAFYAIYRAIGILQLQSRLNVVETTANLTLDEGNDVVIAKTNAVTLTLPPAATNLRIIPDKRFSSAFKLEAFQITTISFSVSSLPGFCIVCNPCERNQDSAA